MRPTWDPTCGIEVTKSCFTIAKCATSWRHSLVEDWHYKLEDAGIISVSINIAMFGKRQASKTPERFKLNVEFPLVPESLEPHFSRDFPSCVEGIVQTKPGNYITSPVYAKAGKVKQFISPSQNLQTKRFISTFLITYGCLAEDVYNMKLRADDAFVLSFHKSGRFTIKSCLFWSLLKHIF